MPSRLRRHQQLHGSLLPRMIRLAASFAWLIRWTQYVHFSMTPRMRTETSGLNMQLLDLGCVGRVCWSGKSSHGLGGAFGLDAW